MGRESEVGRIVTDFPKDRVSAAKGIASKAVHAGERAARQNYLPTSTPVYLTSSFVYDEPRDLDAVFGNEQPGFVYTRYGNPTFKALETAIATMMFSPGAIRPVRWMTASACNGQRAAASSAMRASSASAMSG